MTKKNKAKKTTGRMSLSKSGKRKEKATLKPIDGTSDRSEESAKGDAFSIKNLLPIKLIIPVWFGYWTCLFVLAANLSWNLLSKVDFGFSVLYQGMGIQQHIDKYGPQNRNFEGFENTSKEERIDIFSQIVKSINGQGVGLEEISFDNGNLIQPFLTEPEQVHLQDVANLVDRFDLSATWSSIVLLGLYLLILYRSYPPLTLRVRVKILTSVFVLVAFILIAFGPTEVFYWFHEQIFPDKHQWFFYYQDSLMTTLMKAPDLFGWIAIELVCLAIAIYMVINGTLNYIAHRFDLTFKLRKLVSRLKKQLT